MVLFLPLINIAFPGNLQIIYNVFLPLSSVDFIPEEVTEYLFAFSSELQRVYNERAELVGFEDMNTVNNLGSIFYFCVGNIIFYVLASVLYSFIYSDENQDE